MTEPTKKQPEPRRLNVQLPADLAAIYSNFALISHSAWEVFIDFAQILPNLPQARVRSRIVLAPANAKLLLNALQENIARYEAQHGEIEIPARPPSLADMLFNTIKPDGTEADPKEGDPKNDDQQ
jgi:hypothetical protein